MCLDAKVIDKLRLLKVQFSNLSHRRLMLVKAKKHRDSKLLLLVLLLLMDMKFS